MLWIHPRGEAVPCKDMPMVDALLLGRRAWESSPGACAGAATELEPLLLVFVLHFVRLKF